MYNSSQKESFIRYFGSKQNASKDEVNILYKAFDWLNSFETEWECDLSSQHNDEELKFMVDKLIKLRVRSEDFLIVFRNYIRWCKQTKIKETSLALLDVVPNDILEIQYSTVSSPSQLQKYLSALFRPEIDHTVDNVYRTFLWLGFAGMEERDTYKLEEKHVNLDDEVIEYNGLEFPIYKEGIPAVKYCKEDKSFMYYNDNYVGGPIERYRYPSKQLLRGIRSEYTLENRMMRVQISKIQKSAFDNKQTAMRVSYFNVWRSGVFYREYILEKENHTHFKKFEDVAEVMLRMGTRSYKGGESATEKQKFERIVRDLNRFYKRWKIAHGYD